MPGPKLGSPDSMPALLDLTEGQLPEIKTWKIGDKYKIVIEGELVRQGKGYDGSGPHSATFKVLSANSAGKSTAKTPPPPASRTDRLAVVANKAQAA